MALTDVRSDVITIVNEVQRKLGLNTQTTLTATKLTTVLLDFLNDVIDEVSDLGNWPQMFREVNITAQSSVGEYKVAVSSDVHHVAEITWGGDVAPLEVRTVEDIRRLQRLTSFGVPRQFAITGVSGTSPKFRTYPVPASAAIANASANNSAGAVFDIWYYKKPRMYTTADVNAIPAFPARMLVQGVYAKALLEESSGEESPQFVLAYQEYVRMRSEALNRLTTDTGTDMYITPTGGRYA
jgi:hypothetical protein